MVTDALTKERAWQALHTVADPEIPVLSVVDLGVVRDVRLLSDGVVEVDLTPTYSGCPAMKEMERGVVEALEGAGASRVQVNLVFTPAWTTDWISPDARDRLRAYGIAPPQVAQADSGDPALVPLRRSVASMPCPFCGSSRTEERSHFGSTACKSLYVCRDCRQPFEHFKAI